jgi:hypothetical protein
MFVCMLLCSCSWSLIGLIHWWPFGLVS